jgi:hypothetical protein
VKSPSVVRRSPDGSRTESDCEWVREQLRATWPGVHRIAVTASSDVQPSRRFGLMEAPERLVVEVTVSGPADYLLELGLVTPALLAQIPPCGSKSWARYELHRTARGIRLRFGVADWSRLPGARASRRKVVGYEAADRAWDAMTRALAPRLWRPPAAVGDAQ